MFLITFQFLNKQADHERRNIIQLLSFSVSEIAGINLEDFEQDEDVLVLGGSTLSINNYPRKMKGEV